MSEKKAQAPKEFKNRCKLPKDAPEWLSQPEPNRAHPEMIRLIKEQHNQIKRRASNMISNVLLRDSGS